MEKGKTLCWEKLATKPKDIMMKHRKRLQPGEILQERYEIVSFLGQGGAGAVYLCNDLRLKGKRWAVKEYSRVNEVDEGGNFNREAKMLAKLRHPNLPTLVDFFSVDTHHYLVMEYVEGDTLANVIQEEGPPQESEVIYWAKEIAEVLKYLHTQERPVIFRDLKPENIIVTEDRQVKLVDFGLARYFDPRKNSDTLSSGSVGYAPPEQWDDNLQTDERSDIYALGATLYFVLTGKPPSPVYGSHRIRPYRPDISPGLEALVLRCLQPKPSQRYASITELQGDLELLSRLAGPVTPPANRKQARVASSSPPYVPLYKMPRYLQSSLLILSTLFIICAAWGVTSLRPTSTTQSDILDTALKQLHSKQYTKAISLLNQIITREPQNARARILLQNAYVEIQHRKAYRIPVLTSLSGIEQDGYHLLYGFALAQKQINRNSDTAIILDLFDDQSNLEKTLELTRTLVQNRNYAVMLGPFSSQQVLAAAPILNNAKFPALAPVASDPRVWDCGEYVFAISEPDDKKHELMAKYFISNGYKKAAVLYDNERIISRTGAEQFIEHFTRLGGTIIFEQHYSARNLDFAPTINQIASDKPDCIFLGEYRAAIVTNFGHTLHRSGMVLPVATMAQAFSPQLLKTNGADLEGFIVGEFFSPHSPDKEVRAFVADMQKTFGGILPYHREANAYDALRLLDRAIRQVGFKREALKRYLASIGVSIPPYHGISGDFGTKPLHLRKAHLIEIHHGRYSTLDTSS